MDSLEHLSQKEVAPLATEKSGDRLSAGGLPKLVVLVPCLNEEQSVAKVVAQVPRKISGVGSVRVLVLDDGSTDSSAERARAAGAHVVSNESNQGLGRTFQTGVRQALMLSADVLVNIDGDGQFDPADIPKLIGPVIAGEADMVTASRFLDPELTPEMPGIKKWGNRWVARIVWLLAGKKFSDVSCGFRAFSREALLRMNLFGGFTYTQETFLDLIFKRLSIIELPVRVQGARSFGESRVAGNIPRYAFHSLKIMLRAAIGYRPFPFFGAIASLFFVAGFCFLGFLLTHYLKTGAFSPHIWAGFVGGSFAFLGIITLVIGFVGDMMVRMRLNQEEILYFLKQAHYTLVTPQDLNSET